ncbi:MAG TPA: hypothetical protein VLX44_04570 [Xanthobacteraceae bacterium]|nr:hypothetical protein [Xanthobacteraceae bacterium]
MTALRADLPADWNSYRLRWETGHALAALCAVVALALLVRAWLIERERTMAMRAANRMLRPSP